MKIKNQFWLIISCFLITFSLANAEWKTYTNTNFINDIVGDSAYFYCGTRGGFTIFSRTDSTFINTYTNVASLPSNHIYSLIFDNNGDIWCGTDRGITIFNPLTKTFRSYRDLGSIEQNTITCFERSGDTILVGTINGLFVIDTKGTSSFDDDIIIPRMLPAQFSCKVFSLAADDDFWIGACPGVIRLSRDLQTYTTYLHPFGDSVKAMTIVLDTLYLATEKGIIRYNGFGFDTILAFPESYSVFDLQYQDKFYVATNAGLISYDWQNLYFILSEQARTIFMSDGLWVGVGDFPWFGGGLKHYQNYNWQGYKSRGLESNNVSCVILDNQGTIYATHYPTLTDNFKKISCKRIDDTWQTINDTLIDCNLAVVSKDGYVWFGHWALNGGISRYDPQNDSWCVKTWAGDRGAIGALGIDNNDVKWVYNQYQYNPIIAIDNNGNEIEFSIPGLSRPERGGYEFAFDSQNRVWLGNLAGLLMIDYNNTLLEPSDDTYKMLPYGEVNSVAVDAQNHIWCATASGAALLEDESFRVYNTTRMTRVKADSWGNVWFLYSEGVMKYNIYTKEWVSYTDKNSDIIPNVENDGNFYQWLHINEDKGFLLISTKEGISQFFYTPSPPESLSEIIVYPNPFIANRHRAITFDSLPIDAVVRIYTLEGKLIAELKSNNNFAGARWVPGNLATGIYLAVVSAEGKNKISKFAIIR